jgi:hypothetical protein
MLVPRLVGDRDICRGGQQRGQPTGAVEADEEHHLAKVRVADSSPVVHSTQKPWSSPLFWVGQGFRLVALDEIVNSLRTRRKARLGTLSKHDVLVPDSSAFERGDRSVVGDDLRVASISAAYSY